jgi:drug/metabolite transporter (DMT)-like permease
MQCYTVSRALEPPKSTASSAPIPRTTWLALVGCNLLWAANPMMSKILLERFHAHQVAWLRYFSATLAFVIFWWAAGLGRPQKFFAWRLPTRDWLLVLGMGFSAFCFAPLVALTGLTRTGAVDNAILIALEPLVTVGLAAVFLKEKFNARGWVSLAFSLSGLFFLSGLVHRPLSTWLSHTSFVGNLIIVFSLVGEGAYSIFARILSPRYATLPIFGTSLTLGFIILSGVVTVVGGVPDLSVLGLRHWLALLWLGPLGSTVTYLYWIKALKSTDVSSAALTLFVQPVAGALLGLFVFSETFGLMKALGALLILMGVGIGAGLGVGLLTQGSQKSDR